MLSVETVQPHRLLRSSQLRFRLLSEVHEERGMHIKRGRLVAALGQPLSRVFADGFENAESSPILRPSFALDKALVDQRREAAWNVRSAARANCICCVKCE